MKLIKTHIPGPLIIEPEVFNDSRGFFLESWNMERFAAAGLDISFVQDNHSRSNMGVLCGLHFQTSRPQGKLLRVVAGAVFDVAVDIRRSSPHFGQWVGTELTAENKRMFWIPPGFAHGFLSLADETDVLYKCTTLYSPVDEGTIRWNDEAIGIEWPLNGVVPHLSAKDAAAPLLIDSEAYA